MMDKEEWGRMKRLGDEAAPLHPDILDNPSEEDKTATTREVVRTWLRVIIGEDM